MQEPMSWWRTGRSSKSRSYDGLFAAAPTDTRVVHVLLRVSFAIALERVTSDSERGARALSCDRDFLRSTHETFREIEASLPHPDLEVDTSGLSATEVADRVARYVLNGATDRPA